MTHDPTCTICKVVEHKDTVLKLSACSFLAASVIVAHLANTSNEVAPMRYGAITDRLRVPPAPTTSTTIERVVKPSVSRSKRIVNYGAGILHKIMMCESGGNPKAENPTSSASGLFQFIDSTWNRFKGYARALHAPPAIQWERARIQFATSGTTAWNASRSCWAA